MHRQHTALYKNHHELEPTIETKEFTWLGHEINLKIKNRLKIFVTVSPILDMSLWLTEEQSYTRPRPPPPKVK